MADSSRPRPLQAKHLRSVATPVLLLACLLALAFLPGCVRKQDVSGCQPSGGFCSGLDLHNVRIEIANQPSLQQSETLWISAKTTSPSSGSSHVPLDQLAVRWDSYILHITSPACDQDMCDPRARCGAVFGSVGGVDVPSVQACKGFMQCESPSPVPIVFGGVGYASGCPCVGTPPSCLPGGSPQGESPPVFTANSNATYQVVAPALVQKSVLKSQNLFVISTDSQMATYQMLLQPHNCDPAMAGCSLITINTPSNCNPATSPACKIDYRWTVGATTTNGMMTWTDNFSQNLEVSKVRILKGKPSTDPNSNLFRVTCDKPDCSVRPSRIVFVSDYDTWVGMGNNLFNHPDEASHRCYDDPKTSDGDIDLTHCRRSAGGMNNAVFQVTPTIGDNNQNTLNGVLSWFAEFNPNELDSQGRNVGEPPPSLGPGEVLAIEFTIQQR